MTTDDERRDVAGRLRGNQEDTLIPHRTGRHHGMGCHEAADRFWNMCDRIKEAGNYDIAFSTASVLADLIEPSIPADPGEAGLACVDAFIREHTEKPVDRDALLALADEIELDGAGSLDDDDWCKPLLVEYAQRIREALGVES